MLMLTVNGKARTVDARPDMPLPWVLRDKLGLAGIKLGFGAPANQTRNEVSLQPHATIPVSSDTFSSWAITVESAVRTCQTSAFLAVGIASTSAVHAKAFLRLTARPSRRNTTCMTSCTYSHAFQPRT